MSSRRRALRGYLFILPAMLLLAVFLVYPTVWTVLLSFDTGRGLDFDRFVGLDNYVELFTGDRLFLDLSRFPPSGAVVNHVEQSGLELDDEPRALRRRPPLEPHGMARGE